MNIHRNAGIGQEYLQERINLGFLHRIFASPLFSSHLGDPTTRPLALAAKIKVHLTEDIPPPNYVATPEF
jgi:hypothetical protein